MPKMIVYLPSNIQESRPPPLSLIDNTSHLEAKRSMRLMVCISGQKKKARREREREREPGNRYDHQLYHRMMHILVPTDWPASSVFLSRKRSLKTAQDQSIEEVIN